MPLRNCALTRSFTTDFEPPRITYINDIVTSMTVGTAELDGEVAGCPLKSNIGGRSTYLVHDYHVDD